MDTTRTNAPSTVNQILVEISKLNPAQRQELYDHLRREMVDKREVERRVNSYRGIGRGVWGMDAQEYINQMRVMIDRLRDCHSEARFPEPKNPEPAVAPLLSKIPTVQILHSVPIRKAIETPFRMAT